MMTRIPRKLMEVISLSGAALPSARMVVVAEIKSHFVDGCDASSLTGVAPLGLELFFQLTHRFAVG